MNIMLIADADSIWTKKYIENILLLDKNHITITSWNNSKFFEFYKSNGITVNILENNGKIFRWIESQDSHSNIAKLLKKIYRRISLYLNLRKSFFEGSTFDVIHIHYIYSNIEKIIYRFLKRYDTNIIMTYWGSDLFRNKLTSRDNAQLLQKAKAITFMSDSLYNHFRNIYGIKYDNKLHIIDFGVSCYDNIEKIQKDKNYRNRCKSLYELPFNKIVIAMGYNGSPAQQHLEMLKAFGMLPKKIQEKCYLVIQYSYRQIKDDYYYRTIQKNLHKLYCEWKIIDYFLNDEQISHLRCATDIFIHAQLTDALSASMLEYLYAGALVLNGKWLDYEILAKNNIFYLNFANFKELTAILKVVLGKNSLTKSYATDQNKKILYNMNSWNAVKKSWLNLYASCREGCFHEIQH